LLAPLVATLIPACGAIPTLATLQNGEYHVTSWRESIEAELDVIVCFDDEDWPRVQADASHNRFAWARARVLEQLARYHDDPPAYFLSQPVWIARSLPFDTRINIEILGHALRDDNQIRFSEFLGTRYMWEK